MTLSRLKSEMAYNAFYRKFYQFFIYAVVAGIVTVLVFVIIVLYILFNRPLPAFYAIGPKGDSLKLAPFDEPNLLSTTITRWARKAALTAYTFDFYNYESQLQQARPYFTPAGWNDYLNSVNPLIETIRQNQLIVNSVVSAPPVIANQGDLPGTGYTWRVQIPFLVTYQTAETTRKQSYTVILTIVKISTRVNPTAIGIDQFVMQQ